MHDPSMNTCVLHSSVLTCSMDLSLDEAMDVDIGGTVLGLVGWVWMISTIEGLMLNE